MGLAIIKLCQRYTSSQQWAGLIALAILLTGLTFSYLVTGQIRQQLIIQQQQLATNLVHDASILLRTNLRNNDRVSANVILQDWVDQELILSATLYDAMQQPIAEQGLLELSDYDVFWLDQKVTDDNQLIGHLRVAINMSGAYEISHHNAILMIFSSLMLSLVIGGLAYLWGERIALSNKQQLLTIQSLHTNNLPSEISQAAYSSNDDTLTKAINKLVTDKQQKAVIKNSLNNFISNPLQSSASHLSYQNSALLFIQIEGFAELQKSLTAKDLSDTLNHYHQLLSHAAKLYNGSLDRYINDSLIIVFSNPSQDTKNASHCLYAAQLFLGLVEQLQSNDKDLHTLDFKLAAHWGPILMAPKSMQKNLAFNLMGDTVHWTAQLAQKSQSLQLLVSQDLVEQLTDAYTLSWQDGLSINDLNAEEQPTRWLESLPDNAEKLIDRQVKHILAIQKPA